MKSAQEIDALLRSYLPKIACAACAADIAAGVDPRRLKNDTVHCPFCHLNMPTIIAMATRKSENGLVLAESEHRWFWNKAKSSIVIGRLQHMSEALVRRLPQLTKKQRAERVAVIKAANRVFTTLALVVRREFAGIENWNQLSNSKASVVSIIVSAIQHVDSASDELTDKATRTVRQEIYAIEEWPTTKRIVLSRATAAIRRLKLGGRIA
jgi:hypothetical protein